jgi:hypothetical protein
VQRQLGSGEERVVREVALGIRVRHAHVGRDGAVEVFPHARGLVELVVQLGGDVERVIAVVAAGVRVRDLRHALDELHVVVAELAPLLVGAEVGDVRLHALERGRGCVLGERGERQHTHSESHRPERGLPRHTLPPPGARTRRVYLEYSAVGGGAKKWRVTTR